MFYVFLKGRNVFLDYIKKKLKSSKNWIFPKGLVHGFGQRLVIFPHFYFRENKGLVHGFGQKLVIFLDFYFREKRPEECVLRYCRRKKRLSRL